MAGRAVWNNRDIVRYETRPVMLEKRKNEWVVFVGEDVF